MNCAGERLSLRLPINSSAHQLIPNHKLRRDQRELTRDAKAGKPPFSSVLPGVVRLLNNYPLPPINPDQPQSTTKGGSDKGYKKMGSFYIMSLLVRDQGQFPKTLWPTNNSTCHQQMTYRCTLWGKFTPPGRYIAPKTSKSRLSITWFSKVNPHHCRKV